jgi:hypothetical protein
VAVWLIAGAAHLIEEPDLGDPGTLSPTGTGDHGSSRLATLLAERGVVIDRVTSSQAAIRAATGYEATVFLPAPDFVHPAFALVIAQLPGVHRVVLVRPGSRTLLLSPLPIGGVGSRWATATVEPSCGIPFAERAGAAAALRDRYELVDTAGVHCYAGGLVRVRDGNADTFLIGATDPFRNDRIRESGNADLATGLLGEHGRVIWLDLHQREPTTVNLPGQPEIALPEYRRAERDRTATGNPLIDVFPSGLWAGLLLAAVAAVLLALARARRLGPPVAEPLPVLVPAAEAVTGRGRLYARVRAREATLEALRLAAIRRLRPVVDPFGGAARERELAAPGPTADAFVTRLADRSGWPESDVRAALYGHPPEDDDGLARAVAHLDALVETALRDNAAQRRGGTP